MATLPTPEEIALKILSIYSAHKSRPGHALRPNNFVLPMHEAGLQGSDFAAGLEYAKDAGWLEDGPNQSFRLTEAGFNKMP